MQHASVNDMIAVFGELEVIQVTDRLHQGLVNLDIANNALLQGSILMDTYLARYTPLAAPVAALVRPCCDIARYYLCGASTQMTMEIENRYDKAIAWLKLVASGTVNLGINSEGAEIEPDSDSVMFTNAGNRVFSRDNGKLS